jgi:hypothetical protein
LRALKTDEKQQKSMGLPSQHWKLALGVVPVVFLLEMRFTEVLDLEITVDKNPV